MNDKSIIIEQIEKILDEYEDLKKSYPPLKYPVAYKDTEEGAKISKLMTRVKSLISKYPGRNSEYYKQVETHTSKISRRNLALAIADLQALFEEINFESSLEKEITSENDKEMSDQIFIVHGKNEEMKQSVARLLEKLELKPIILHEQPNEGKTIIEKFESYSDVGFAVILLSPDDLGFSKEDGPKNIRSRARQNVILELGYFLGKLGRERVVALYFEDKEFEMPSDISGILYIKYDKSGAWKYNLIDELKATGYNISKDNI